MHNNSKHRLFIVLLLILSMCGAAFFVSYGAGVTQEEKDAAEKAAADAQKATEAKRKEAKEAAKKAAAQRGAMRGGMPGGMPGR